MPLRNHLSSDQDIDLPLMHILKGFIGAALGLEIIAVNSQTPGVWPEFSDFLFNPLGTDTDREDIGCAAPRAARRNPLRIAAMVADQASRVFMKDHKSGAVGARRLPAAGRAHQHRRESPAVDIDKHLLMLLQRCPDRFLHLFGKHLSFFQRPCIDKTKPRRLRFGNRLMGQREKPVASASRAGPAFK